MPSSSLLFHENPNPMLIFDMETLRITEVNQSAVEKYGYSKEEFGNLTIKDIRPPEDIPEFRKTFKTLSSGTNPQVIGTHRHKTKEGELFYAKITTQPLPDEQGQKRVAHIFDVTELVDLKQDYNETCQELAKHIETNPLALIKFNSNFEIVRWPPRAEELSGFKAEEMVGKNPLETGFIVEEERGNVLNRMKALTSGEYKSDYFETIVKNRDGKRLDIKFHTSVLRDPDDGSLQSVLTFLEDISEEKDYQRKLEQEQQRLERAQQLAKCGWWSYEVKDNRVIWSDIMYELLGVEKEAFGATFDAFYNLVHPEDCTRLEQVMRSVEQSTQPVDYQLRILNEGDELIYIDCRAQSEFNSDGEMVRISGIVQVVTKQVKSQKQLERNRTLFQNLFLQSPVAMVMIDKKRKIQRVNESFMNLFGYQKEELLGEELLRILLPEERYNEIPSLYKNAFSGRQKYYEDQRINKDGEKIDVLVGALPVIINGSVDAVFGIYVDVTRLKMTESQLKESLHEKEVLLAEIHHRVKNNLAIVSGLLELEGMDWQDEKIRNAFMESQLRIKSIAMIHEKLYQTNDFANLQFEDYIEELVVSIIDTLNISSKQIETEVDADDIRLNINQAIPCALVINELVTNAVEHGFEGAQKGKVTVKMKEEAGNIKVEVKDNGRGLPDKNPDIYSHSLGLTLVKQLVKQLDAKIETRNGEGACFEMVFKKKAKTGAGSNYFV
ncbi:PAS domain S-box protein [Aliifodinibius sp. S!AR15-10]|uniref:PAS domain-containing sensor histidine kinase n=1 Tax=Aliifodinibius sp. S!AR15-10 TaxID=2950437 RepID=UPI002866489B|nr:PAS domain S-box protein [Aliifodinibius sp. S!AR15-10]MDR8391750.1 PAS domain S-box protein [Aliifodinibius sp. S!AR15-10]